MLLEDFYKVENTTTSLEGDHTAILRINNSHHLYNGHFPHRPVTPGVMLMQLFKEDAERTCGKTLYLKKAVNVKFMAVVDPNEDPQLVLEYSLENIDGELGLKGVARHKGAIAIKFNARYGYKES
ncbi:hydroxymyristoyl-ACP dehydratase [Antarcticibacterium flavum]|uniref:Hydroxymyristoyl-ACP dehydratase n=1 Tax=Antarcticibacterium flavum TaxID=2058175 RepID=A0A5B7WY19_9FLAO|nr:MULTISPECIES: hydroxymyristoyl-ACP dehydratase [Antarcticibacterium]MCM4158830.1 hydroxymyristoyl-ACP dehydratase [Antarcticibacterium sp. W02-3]QCY68094.1 hydroxymyristoyl-ACP dehydratase [Antarcticibacterium flavum]